MNHHDGTSYYHGVPGLLVPKSGHAYEEIHSNINRFIDTIPRLVEAMEANLTNIDNEKQRTYLISDVEKLGSLLKNVYARGLEADAMRLLRFVKSDIMTEQARKLLPSFIMDLLSLSVAMQKAQRFVNKETEEVSEIEFHASIARDLSAVISLIDENIYRSAKKMITELAVYNPEDEKIVKLLHLMAARRYGEAKALADILYARHTEAISELAGIDMSKKVLAVDDMPEMRYCRLSTAR
jgi:hypothetical protein